MALMLDYGLTYPQRLNSRGFFEFTGDLRLLVRSSIYQILGTWIGERVMEPEFGSRLRELLFEPIDDIAIALARVYTIQAIERWEPRIQLNDVVASIEPEQGVLTIYASYTLVNRNVDDSIVVAIPRRTTGER